MTTLKKAQAALRRHRNPAKARFHQGFFKTGPGEYSEGDRFLGITVPVTRSVAREFRDMGVPEALALLESQWHEERLMALEIMDMRYESAARAGNRQVMAAVYAGYMARIRKFVNNWDLVDASAHVIAGRHLEHRSRAPIHRLSRSGNLWEKRVAMISTFWYIRRGDFTDALRVAETLLGDSHDLIHKAVGWMLREIGNRDPAAEKKFLDRHAARMPRTALRYAIEKFPEKLRKKYLAIKRAAV